MHNPRILLVEDHLSIRREIVAALDAAGFTVEVTMTVAEAKRALHRAFDCVLLDLGLPDGDGLDVCRELRASGSGTPILILTARDAPEMRVAGLEAGADDYVTKPYHPPELMIRIKNLLRRSKGAMAQGRIRCGDVWADPDSRAAGRGDEALVMKPREFDLLLFLMRNPQRAWTRSQLLSHVWGIGFDGDERTVDSHVRRLRSLIEDDSSNPLRLETVWGVGYRWSE